ncbi:MAG: HD domain-containing protein [Bdellovibrionaceae bacterium]|nr:HD domain-containing protein [Pseudobdellovibrionaceae bacterium]
MAIDAQRLRSLIEEARKDVPVPTELYRGFADTSLFQPLKDKAAGLADLILAEFDHDPRFRQGDPVLLGSWARAQITPKSDLDLGFWTDNADTQAFIRELQATKLPLRARLLTPEEIRAWPIPEQLAFLEAKALTELSTVRTEGERTRIMGLSRAEKKKWVKALQVEREQRHRKGYEFENVLEPHVKTGRGGLRDTQQAFQLMALLPEVWSDPHFIEVMDSCRWFLLQVRFELQALGSGDFLQAGLQIEIGAKLGYPHMKDFMRELQLCLSRVAFYGDVMFEMALASNETRARVQSRPFSTGEELVRALKKDAGLLTQYQVRRQMDDLITAGWLKKNADLIEEFKGFLFAKSTPEKFLRAAFRSRLLDQLDPRLRALVGYNQHDQYHAFTAETHILNLLLLLKKSLQHPRTQGLFAKAFRTLSARDESILAWSCFYHDLAKGQGGDHEAVGEKWVRDDGRKFERSEQFTEEVGWLVRHHLDFSVAAFREDPRSETTWRRLFDLGLNPGRIRRLALFTVLDIQATHPKAWTPWKEKLMFELMENLLDPSRLKSLKAQRKLHEEFGFTRFELPFIEAVGSVRIAKDLRRLVKSKTDTGFYIEKTRGGYWVRYFTREDAPGVLVTALKSLFAAGASVQEAWVHGIPGFGVYDWFFVSSTLQTEVFERRLQLLDPAKVTLPQVKWSQVEIERPPESKLWTLHLSGDDQRGLLVWTAEKIRDLGGNIQSARIQTWGARAEDHLVVDWNETPTIETEKRLRGELLGVKP